MVADRGRAPRPIERAGDADSGADHRPPLHMSFRQDLLHHPGGSVQGGLRVVAHVEIAPPLGQHVVADIGDGDSNMAVAEVDAHHRQRGIAQHQQHRRPPTTKIGNPGLNLVNDARVLELSDEGVHRCARQARHPRDFRLADVPPLPQRPHHPLAVSVSQPAERPLSLLVSRLVSVFGHGAPGIMDAQMGLSRLGTNWVGHTIALLTNVLT